MLFLLLRHSHHLLEYLLVHWSGFELAVVLDLPQYLLLSRHYLFALLIESLGSLEAWRLRLSQLARVVLLSTSFTMLMV